ncbi:hypothetical protein D3C72_1156630 [compost metagenome]
MVSKLENLSEKVYPFSIKALDKSLPSFLAINSFCPPPIKISDGFERKSFAIGWLKLLSG